MITLFTQPKRITVHDRDTEVTLKDVCAIN